MEVAMTTAELSQSEKEYLAHLLSKRHSELLHELHHAFTREYKAGLKQEIELTDQLKQKLAP
jgi:hypothetical protein